MGSSNLSMIQTSKDEVLETINNCIFHPNYILNMYYDVHQRWKRWVIIVSSFLTWETKKNPIYGIFLFSVYASRCWEGGGELRDREIGNNDLFFRLWVKGSPFFCIQRYGFIILSKDYGLLFSNVFFQNFILFLISSWCWPGFSRYIL